MKAATVICLCLLAAVVSGEVAPNYEKMGWRLVKLHADMPAVWVDPATAASFADQFAHQWGYQDITYVPVAAQAPTPKAGFAYPTELSHIAEVNALLGTSSPGRIMADLEALSEFNNRYYTADSGVASSEWIRDRLQDIIDANNRTADASVELFTHSQWPQASVIARITPANNNPNIVILGAHCDSIAPNMPSGRAPGADDDGTGTVVVMEIFRILLENNFFPGRTLEFQFYAAEELGLLGSADMANTYASQNRPVYAMNQLDMNGYIGSSADLRLMYDAAFMDRDLTDFVELCCHEYSNLNVVYGGYNYAASDHASWTRAGYPAAHFKESSSYPYIHTANDLPEHINEEYMWEFVGPALGFVVELADHTLVDRYDW